MDKSTSGQIHTRKTAKHPHEVMGVKKREGKKKKKNHPKIVSFKPGKCDQSHKNV